MAVVASAYLADEARLKDINEKYDWTNDELDAWKHSLLITRYGLGAYEEMRPSSTEEGEIKYALTLSIDRLEEI